MSDVEMLCARNWEQRRHAEEYAATIKWDWEGAMYADAVTAEKKAQEREARKAMKRKRKLARAARDAGRVALGMGTVSTLMGLDLLGPLFGLIAVLFYTAKFELQPGNEQVWQKIFG